MLRTINRSKNHSVKYTFIAVIILLPIMVLSAIEAGLSGLEGTNPENQGKSIVFPIGNDAAKIVKTIFGFVIVPISLLMVVLGSLNLKYKNQVLNWSLIILSFGMIFWLAFSFWALNAKFVTSTNINDAPSSKNRFNDQNDLKIRTFELK